MDRYELDFYEDNEPYIYDKETDKILSCYEAIILLNNYYNIIKKAKERIKGNEKESNNN